MIEGKLTMDIIDQLLQKMEKQDKDELSKFVTGTELIIDGGLTAQ